MEAKGKNSISNKAVHSQCPSIGDLLTTLATSDLAFLSWLFSDSNHWPADDELDGFSGHFRFVLERERKKRKAMNEISDRRQEGQQGINGQIGKKTQTLGTLSTI